MNVTFMNFNDPSYDLTTVKFVNTTGTNVQIGVGSSRSPFVEARSRFLISNRKEEEKCVTQWPLPIMT